MPYDLQILKTLNLLVETLESINQPIVNSPLQDDIEDLHSKASMLINQKFSRLIYKFEVD